MTETIRSWLKICDLNWTYTIIDRKYTIIREKYTISFWKYTIFYLKAYDPQTFWISSNSFSRKIIYFPRNDRILSVKRSYASREICDPFVTQHYWSKKSRLLYKPYKFENMFDFDVWTWLLNYTIVRPAMNYWLWSAVNPFRVKLLLSCNDLWLTELSTFFALFLKRHILNSDVTAHAFNPGLQPTLDVMHLQICPILWARVDKINLG